MTAKCVECGIAIGPGSDHSGICGRGLVCYVCAEMFGAIHEKEWWVLMQEKYLAEMKHKRGLAPGGEYLT